MSTTPKKPTDKKPSVGQQRRQASILLSRLQWLVFVLLIIGLAWLYISQQRFQNQVNKRLQSNEQVVTRLNEMDDKLYAISQQQIPTTPIAVGNQAQNQLDLLRLQIQAADSLLSRSNPQAAIDLLSGLQWQLAQDSNEIAPALTIVIQQSLKEDIERLQAQSAQPSLWQLHNLAIQDIQESLSTLERRYSDSKSDKGLTRWQLKVHEAIMTLNLAVQASNMQQPEQLVTYLNQAKKQLQNLHNEALNTNNKLAAPSTNQSKSISSDTDNAKAPTTLAEVIVWLDELIVKPPSATPLLTSQILEQESVK